MDGPTLAELVAAMPDLLLRPLCDPALLDVPVVAPVLYDADAPFPMPGALVLAVGVDPASAATPHLVATCARAGVAGVVLKIAGTPPPALAAPPVAVLGTPAETDWAVLHGHLHLAVGGSGDRDHAELAALAEAVATITGGAATVEDAHGRVVVRSSTWRPVSVGAQRVSVPVHTRDGYAGVVTVTAIGTPLRPDAARTVEDAARVASRHLVAVPVRDEAVDALLTGHGDLEAAAARLGLAPGARCVVVAFAVSGDVPSLPERIARAVSLTWQALHGTAFCAATGRTVYAVVPLADPAAVPRVVETARRAAREAESLAGVPVHAGVGSTADRLADIAESRRTAEQVLRAVVAHPGADRVADVDAVRTDLVLLALRDATVEHPELSAGAVAPLVSYDAEHGTAYVETLRAYLDEFGYAAAAAERLCIHVKTLRYRLRRIAELSGIRLDDPDERLAVQLELRLRDES